MSRITSAVAACLLLASAACGDDPVRACAAGTKPDPSGKTACVLDEEQRQCAPGTKPDPTGASCIPDGTAVCGAGSTFDTATGKCVADAPCAAGQVLVNGTCTADVHPDAEEAAEPNDDAGAGTIPLPEVGAPGYVVHGCVVPRDGGATADHDPWLVTVDGPTLLDVTAAGVGGLTAGFEVTPRSDDLAPLAASGWRRFGANLVDTTSRRQIFLPAAGTYNLDVGDSRQLSLNDAPTGSERACYFATIAQLALPAPTRLTGDTFEGTISGDVQFFSARSADGTLVFSRLRATGAAPSLVQLAGGAYQRSVDASFFLDTVDLDFGGVRADAPVVIAVDTEFNLVDAPVPYTLTLITIGAEPLSAAAPNAPGTQLDGVLDDFRDLTYYWFDAAEGELVHLDLTFPDGDANFLVMDSTLTMERPAFTGTVNLIHSFFDLPGLDDGPQTSAFAGWYRIPAAGRYYVAVFDPDLAPGDSFRMTSRITRATPARLGIGDAIVGHPLGAVNAEWLSLDPTAETWIALAAAATNVTGGLHIDFYADDDFSAGLVDVDLASSFGRTLADPGTPLPSRITFGDPTKYLLRVSQGSAAAVDPQARFDLTATRQAFLDAGTFVAGTPLDRLGERLGAPGGRKLYFVRGEPGTFVNVPGSPRTK